MFLATFFNVAFYHEIMQALGGETVSIRRGYGVATARWKAILLWSLFAGLVGYILHDHSSNTSDLWGELSPAWLASSWSTACVFIIPALVREEQTENPLKLLRSSVGTLKRSWGELVVGFVGLEMAFGLYHLMFVLRAIIWIAGVGGLYLGLHFNIGESGYSSMAGVGVYDAAWSSLPFGLGLQRGEPRISAARCFIFATEGVVPGTFDKELLYSAWKVK